MYNRDSATINPTIASNKITTLAASGVTDSIPVGGYVEAIVFLNVTANSGTTPTLDCGIDYSPDGINWIASGDAFTQITTVNGLFFKKLSANFGRFIRLNFVLGGTTPNYTVAPSLVVKQ